MMNTSLDFLCGAYLLDRARLVHAAKDVTAPFVVSNPAGTYEVKVITTWYTDNTVNFRCVVKSQESLATSLLLYISRKIGKEFPIHRDPSHMAALYVVKFCCPEINEFFDPLLSPEQRENLGTANTLILPP